MSLHCFSHRTRALAGAFLAMTFLVSCGRGPGASAGSPAVAAEGSSAPAVAFVVGAHANAPAPRMSSQVGALVEASDKRAWHAAVVTADGDPRVVGRADMSITARNPVAAGLERKRHRSDLEQEIASARASSPEVDTLGAIVMAAREISAAHGSRTIVVLDSGVQTVAPLRFQDPGMLDAAPDDVVRYLVEQDALPRLDGVHVVLSGVGDTFAPQARLSASESSNLLSIWTAVLRRGGATVDVDQQPSTAPALPGLPPVTPVPVAPPPRFAPDQRDIELPNQSVSFRPGTAAYVDPAAVRAVLRPLAAALVARPRSVHIAGYTASDGSAAYRRDLALHRAAAVKQTLLDLGVRDAGISVEGVGSDWPGYVPDRDETGRLLPGPAAANRKVVVSLG